MAQLTGNTKKSASDFNMYKRFFAFGCSFTDYPWSTWADIIAHTMPNTEYYNFGKAGGGNALIHARLMEADQRYNFDSNDLVIVQWTNTAREDRYLNDRGNVGWVGYGNIYTNTFYDDNFIAKYCDPFHFLLRDLANIKAINTLLNYKKVNYYYLSLCNIVETINQWSNIILDTTDQKFKVAANLYKPFTDKIRPDYLKIIFNGDFMSKHIIKTKLLNSNKEIVFDNDYHPSPLMHLSYLQQVLPEIVIKPKTVVAVEQENEKLYKEDVVDFTTIPYRATNHKLDGTLNLQEFICF